MSKLQRWLIVIAIWIITVCLLVYIISKRYIIESYTFKNKEGVVQTAGVTKTDTWTGRMFLKMTYPLSEDMTWVEIK